MRNATPATGIARMNPEWMPSMYADRTPGISAAGKAVLISVAPMAATRPGLRLGLVRGRARINLFWKMDWPPDTMSDPPRDWKTGGILLGRF